jgi:hypothetical protein
MIPGHPGRDWSSRRRKFGEHAIAAGVEHPPIVTRDDRLHHLALGEVVDRPALILGDEAAEPDDVPGQNGYVPASNVPVHRETR